MIFSVPSIEVSLVVHFHPLSECSSSVCTLYDPTTDSSSAFLSMRGLQLQMLACFTRCGMMKSKDNATSNLSDTNGSASTVAEASRGRVIAVVVTASNSLLPGHEHRIKFLNVQVNKLRKKEKAELISKKKAEISALRKKFDDSSLRGGNDENDESAVNLGGHAQSQAQQKSPSQPPPSIVPPSSSNDNLHWLVALEESPQPSSPYDPRMYGEDMGESLCDESNVLTGSVALPSSNDEDYDDTVAIPSIAASPTKSLRSLGELSNLGKSLKNSAR